RVPVERVSKSASPKKYLQGKRMPELPGDYPPACGSHHRPMVDWLVGRLSQHSTAWPRWLRSVVTTG
ncbi:MAG: hypothetical protein ACK523_01120, partial [Pirellulaceae bacterium]